VPKDAESGGSNFTEKVTALWPPRRPRTSVPGVERTTVKAHVLAHVARSRRNAGRAARPEFALPWNRKQPLELPLPPSRPPARGSQTTPRLDGDHAPAAARRAPPEASGAGPAAPAAASAPAAPRAASPPPAPGAVAASEASGPLAAPSASAADAWVDPTPASRETAMPPLYAGISPYRHALPATLFELTAVSPAPATAPAPATGVGTGPPRVRIPGRQRHQRGAHARPARRAARARHALGRPLSVLVFLLAVFLWAVAYWQTWEALSMTERCRALWQTMSGTPGGSPADDAPGHAPGI
jgi:hypothetical protein